MTARKYNNNRAAFLLITVLLLFIIIAENFYSVKAFDHTFVPNSFEKGGQVAKDLASYIRFDCLEATETYFELYSRQISNCESQSWKAIFSFLSGTLPLNINRPSGGRPIISAGLYSALSHEQITVYLHQKDGMK
jgi:hypothetical protein